MSHQFMLGLYQWNFGTSFHSWIPSDEDMAWLSKKYPDTFDKYYRPRWEYYKKLKAEGKPFTGHLPKLCQTCQIPTIFTEPDDPTQICQRETTYLGEVYHFCSDSCQHIFENEPEKYVQAWLPMPQLMQEPVKGDLGAWYQWCNLIPGKDTGDYDGSEDQQNFDAWKHQATQNQ